MADIKRVPDNTRKGIFFIEGDEREGMKVKSIHSIYEILSEPVYVPKKAEAIRLHGDVQNIPARSE